MTHKVQQGILANDSDPVLDSDVIITAAIVGHSYTRLVEKNLNCRYDLEVDTVDLPTSQKAQMSYGDVAPHLNCMNKINLCLANGGVPNDKQVSIGVTPIYDKSGSISGATVAITGGTGDLPLTDKQRFDPASLDPRYDPKKIIPSLLRQVSTQSQDSGYQGRGAYTGYVYQEGVQKVDSATLMFTYRFKIPPDDDKFGSRWLPSVLTSANIPPKAAGIGTENPDKPDQYRIWGMIGGYGTQRDAKTKFGMKFQDNDALAVTDIVGYVHGMTQAIYKAVEIKAKDSNSNPSAYEIAVGTQTTKLASCFPCATFMEATGFPASSTHIGRGESWCIVYPNSTDTSDRKKALDASNLLWQNYCKKIIINGLKCMSKGDVIETKHKASFAKLNEKLSDLEAHPPLYFSNLILDALTVHKSEYVRVNDTLISPPNVVVPSGVNNQQPIIGSKPKQ